MAYIPETLQVGVSIACNVVGMVTLMIILGNLGQRLILGPKPFDIELDSQSETSAEENVS